VPDYGGLGRSWPVVAGTGPVISKLFSLLLWSVVWSVAGVNYSEKRKVAGVNYSEKRGRRACGFRASSRGEQCSLFDETPPRSSYCNIKYSGKTRSNL
jgi:hypothetical protein